MEATLLAVAIARPRIHREECKQTKHDSNFSKWQVLVGPSDWENHSLGKEGAERYRVHNLPKGTGPGLYELGIAVPHTGLGRNVDKFHSDGVIVVYIGQADSVRTRLQRYGCTGAHLNSANGCGLRNGLGCFEDIFSRGYSIVYRWAPLKNKADALKTERELLKTIDYAWNKGSNGTRRHDDVLRKLNEFASNSIQLPKPIRKLPCFNQNPTGIKFKASMLPSVWINSSNYADEEGHNFFPQIFKYTKSQPRPLLDRHGAGEGYTSSCVVSLGDGSVCRRPLVEGRKRCVQHKGTKVSACASIPTLTMKGKAKVGDADPMKLPVVAQKCPLSEGFSSICGVILDDGSLCRRPPVQGNKRCGEHKRRKNCGTNSQSTGTSQYVHDADFDSNTLGDFDSNTRGALNSPEAYRQGIVQPRVKLQYDTICGVELGNGKFCTRQPVKGRVRCEEHKGLKIERIKSTSAAQDKSNVYNGGSNLSTFNGKSYRSSVCGEKTLDGSYCRRLVEGNTKCWQHSRNLMDKRLTIGSRSDWSYGGSSLCGARTHNGSSCGRSVRGGGRCWQHSGNLMDKRLTIGSRSDWSYGGSSLCGARTRNGSSCTRPVSGGGRCWQH